MSDKTLPPGFVRIPEIAFAPRYVYLAGPILGCTHGEANDWRVKVAARLREHNITGVSPLRCEPLVGDRYSADYPDPRFGTPRAISAKNKFDVHNCDITLAVLPKPEEPSFAEYAKKLHLSGGGFSTTQIAGMLEDAFRAGAAGKKLPSLGTLHEIAWADEANKMVIQVTNDPFIMKHPVIDSGRGWKLTTNATASHVKDGLAYDTINHALDAAVEVCIGVLGGYTGGKNV